MATILRVALTHLGVLIGALKLKRTDCDITVTRTDFLFVKHTSKVEILQMGRANPILDIIPETERLNAICDESSTLQWSSHLPNLAFRSRLVNCFGG